MGIIANPVNSTVAIAAEVYKQHNVYDPKRCAPFHECYTLILVSTITHSFSNAEQIIRSHHSRRRSIIRFRFNNGWYQARGDVRARDWRALRSFHCAAVISEC